MSNSTCKMQVFHKNVSNRSEKQIRQEVEFQERVSLLGLCPKIIATDYRTYIDMEDIGQMCIADMYGDQIEDIPKQYKYEIYQILSRLYLECNIEYIDVTPYNFIEKDLSDKLTGLHSTTFYVLLKKTVTLAMLTT